jgi:hypothetical protein
MVLLTSDLCAIHLAAECVRLNFFFIRAILTSDLDRSYSIELRCRSDSGIVFDVTHNLGSRTRWTEQIDSIAANCKLYVPALSLVQSDLPVFQAAAPG